MPKTSMWRPVRSAPRRRCPSQSHEYSILVNGMLSKPADYENIIVKTNPATGEMVYLKDVARIELGNSPFPAMPLWTGNDARS